MRLFVCLFCKIKRAIIGIDTSNILEVIGKPISHLSVPIERHLVHHVVINSRSFIRISFGIYKISKKKIIEDKNKKRLRTGVKIIFPAGEAKDIGKPQLINIGNDTIVINNCNCNTLSIQNLNLVVNGDIFIIFLI